ncbi:Phage tape measure protein [Neorhizobium galegae bv. orientalis]|nr:Phage tape measure protein [Neorhizobium galegae bv. orientalis]
MAVQDLEKLVVSLSADITKFDRAMARAQGITNQRTKAIESRFAKMNSVINNGAANAAVAAGKAFALIGGAQGFKSLSDAATGIDNSLKVAGLSGAELERVYQSLFAAATKNAAPIETLVGLYGRLSLVQNELGVSSEQLVSFSSNVALALRVGGTSAQQASGALLGLSQVLGNGKATAEDFNQVLEGAPTILLAAAAGIKEAEGSVAKLRQIMLDGKLSSKAFFDGFQAGAPVLEQKVAGAVFTIDQRLGNLKTALINATREFNQSAKAGETFGNEIDRTAQYINGIDFDAFAGELGKIISLFRQGAASASNLATEIGKLSGLAGVGKSVVDALGGENGKVSYLGGLLTVESTIKSEDQLADIAQRRLTIEKQIAETRANSMDVLGPTKIRQLEAQLAAINEQASTVQPVIKGGPLDYNRFPPVAAPPGTVNPITLADPKYKPPATSKSGGAGGKGSKGESDYAREIEQIKERTLALQAETAAQATVNPLLDDYGFASERASAAHDLLTAAQKSGLAAGKELKDVTQLLSGNFEGLSPAAREQAEAMLGLANGYATASAEAEKLAEKQANIRQAADDFKSTAKSTLSGFISDMRQGKSAAEALEGALDKVIDKLIDVALNSAFDSKSGGGLSSIFSSLFGGGGSAMPTGVGLYDKGGYTGNGGKFQPAGVVHKGEYVMDAESTKRIGVDNLRKLQGYAAGGFVGSAPTLPSLGGSRGRERQIIDVRVGVEKDGNLKAFVQRESAQVSATVVQATAPAIVNQSVSASGSALSKGKFDYGMAKYGQKRSANVG